MKNKAYQLLPAALTVLMVSACQDEPRVEVAQPRTIKTFVVSERAGEQVRVIHGITEAGVVTELAFDVGGQVVELDTKLGNLIQAGAVIARIDEEPYRLRVLTTKGQLSEAEARLVEAQSQFERIAEVYKKSFVSKSEYDKALADLESARSNVQVARTQLELAERDLSRTKLSSPLTGRVTAAYIERYAEVAPGKAVVQVSSEGRLKVNTSVPVSFVGRLLLGTPVGVKFPALDNKELSGRITEIGSRASSTSSFPVVITLDEPDDQVRAGTAAEVTFSFETDATGSAFMLPITAVLPTNEQRVGTVFVYDAASSSVSERSINIVNVATNRLEVTGEIVAGDIVASAGVPFLHDGMAVRLMDAQ